MRLLLIALMLSVFSANVALAENTKPVQLILDTSEADRALAILAKEKAQAPVGAADWQQLFATAPYIALKAREAAIGRPFSDEEFKQFLLSPAAQEMGTEWTATLKAMKASDMTALGTGVLAWLPQGAVVHAKVFPEIKPRHNRFVWTSPTEGPAIFLYLEAQSKDKFENTVAHECHHIGLASLDERNAKANANLNPRVQAVLHWMSGFGEGEAMLAAAGSIDRHPHWEDDAQPRARWDGDMMHFNTDLATMQQFFMDILDGRLTDEEEIGKRAAPFWGDVQGPTYTVGYQMSVLVERQFGRQRFLDCLNDPRLLLQLYNQVALDADRNGATLATWSQEFVARLR